MRIAVAVDGQDGLDCHCGASLETAECWLIVELSSNMVLGADAAPNPLGSGELAGEALEALKVDVVVAAAAGAAARQTLLAQGVRVVTGANGTARKVLIDFVTGSLGVDGRADDGHRHHH